MQPHPWARRRRPLIAISVLLLAGLRRAVREPARGAVDIGLGSSNGRAVRLVRLHRGEIPVVTRQLTGHDKLYINPGAIIAHDGELHMFANVFSEWPGHVAFPHLISSDGETWTKAESSPAFTSDDIPFVKNGADVSSGYVRGRWDVGAHL